MDSQGTKKIKHIAKAVIGIFSAMSAHRFALRVVPENDLGCGRLHAAYVGRWKCGFARCIWFVPIDVLTVADRRPNIDVTCEEVAGGKFCRRGSFFNGSSIPLTAALQHRAMQSCAKPKLGYAKIMVMAPSRNRDSCNHSENGSGSCSKRCRCNHDDRRLFF